MLNLQSSLDLLPAVVFIVRKSVEQGLTHETLDEFDQNVSSLKGNELETYLQNLWDDA